MSGIKPSTSETRLSALVQSIRELFEGRSHATGQCTLTANAATTTVNAKNCGAESVPKLTPLTAHAAAEIGNGTMYVSSVKPGVFVLTHANNAQVDRTYAYALQG